MIKKKGGAGFAVGLAIQEVIETIALDRRRMLPVSSVQNGCYGIRDVALSVPTVVGRAGVVATHEIDLWPKEVQGLAQERPGAAANDRHRAGTRDSVSNRAQAVERCDTNVRASRRRPFE